LTRYLLDVNILLGIAWESQQAHATVFPWFKQTGQYCFATCAITQSGFVRISASGRFSKNPVPVKAALELLNSLTEKPGHILWSMDLGLREATGAFVDKLFGPLQLTDAYLLGLAAAMQGVLVTRDHAIPQLAGKPLAQHILLLP
jgi:uncharacterized protein